MLEMVVAASRDLGRFVEPRFGNPFGQDDLRALLPDTFDRTAMRLGCRDFSFSLAVGNTCGALSLFCNRPPVLGLGALALNRSREARDRRFVLVQALQFIGPLLCLARDFA